MAEVAEAWSTEPFSLKRKLLRKKELGSRGAK
jgi:hypothetical protein